LAKKTNTPTRLVSLRLTEEERQRLESEAQGRGMSAVIRERLFGASARKSQLRVPAAQTQKLAAILSMLGSSDIAANLRSLSDAASSGSLELDTVTRDVLNSACNTVVQLRGDLLVALGLSEGADQ
jgi:hypothetical protein